MARILCELPFASESISGVAFAATDAGMLSEEVSDEVAAGFAAIPGYRLAEAPDPQPAEQGKTPADPDAEGGATAAQQPTPRTSRRRA